MTSPPLWKASVTLAKADAADMTALFELTPPKPQAVLIVEDPFGPDATVEALYDREPDAAFLTQLAGRDVAVEPLPDQDWIRQSQEGLYDRNPEPASRTNLGGRDVAVDPLPDQDGIRKSQEGLPPVRAGRFFVYGAHDAGAVPAGVIPIRIEAGLAFGTGHHETTALVLEALAGLARRRSFRNVVDLGTRTRLLAVGAG